MSPQTGYTLLKTDDQIEALSWVASFLGFVFTHKFSPLSIAFYLAVGINVFSLTDYVSSDKAQIKIADPVSDNRPFSLMPEAVAQSNGELPIVIDKKVYGYYDPAYQVWKLADKPTLLVFHRPSGAVFTVSADALRKDKVQQFKK